MPSHTGLKGFLLQTHVVTEVWGTPKWAGLPVRWETAQTNKGCLLSVLTILPFFTLGEKIPLSTVDVKYNTYRRTPKLPQKSPKKTPNCHENKIVRISTSGARKFSPMVLGFSHQTEVKWTRYFGLKKSSLYPHLLTLITFTTFTYFLYCFGISQGEGAVKRQVS